MKRSNTKLIFIQVSPGELIDKVTILRLKSAKMKNAKALINIKTELDILENTLDESKKNLLIHSCEELTVELQKTNALLWEVEDKLRLFEDDQTFDEEFIHLARSVYKLNDQRASLKRDINILCGSNLLEEKSYGFAGNH